MKILWFTSGPLPRICKELGLDPDFTSGSWLIGSSEMLLADKSVELCICYPNHEVFNGKIDNLYYFSVLPVGKNRTYSDEAKQRVHKIFNDFKPDVITIFGTEHTYQHTMIDICVDDGRADNTVVWVQGLVSVIAKHFNAGLPEKMIKHKTMKEWIKNNNLLV